MFKKIKRSQNEIIKDSKYNKKDSNEKELIVKILKIHKDLIK